MVIARWAVLLFKIIRIDSLEYLNNFLSMYLYFHYITLVSFPEPLPMEDSPSAKPCHPCSKGAARERVSHRWKGFRYLPTYIPQGQLCVITYLGKCLLWKVDRCLCQTYDSLLTGRSKLSVATYSRHVYETSIVYDLHKESSAFLNFWFLIDSPGRYPFFIQSRKKTGRWWVQHP